EKLHAPTPHQIMTNVHPEDLIKFGMIPEFIGRLPVISVLNELSLEDLEHVLLDPRNALTKQYAKLFAMEDVQLTFEREAILAIAQKAVDLKTGARALRSILEGLMLEVMYQVPHDPEVEEVVITADLVNGTAKPLIRSRGEKQDPVLGGSSAA
ncbi:MAG TPA: ATP-dependent Clp protease ATP-binding subunit ClpX, partial [Opitutales bacterium]|nr:ATP-dependent Clp protease ATP-binding subunit ClpX [Opitutales bacterium]